MAANARSLRGAPAFYYPYLGAAPGEGKGLLEALASRACVIVTDEFPCFFLPKMVGAASRKVPVLLEQVDSNGLLPLRAAPKEFTTAFAFRRFLQKQLPEHLLDAPSSEPLSKAKLPSLRMPTQTVRAALDRWPMAKPDAVRAAGSVAWAGLKGGSAAGTSRLMSFLLDRLNLYPEERNEPGAEATSGLSPYLHFGHISAHEIFAGVAKMERWTSARVAVRSNGSRTGWWGMSAAAEAFLDQLVTWRELGFNCCHFRKDYDEFESLPAWAQKTLEEHEGDARSVRYSLEELAHARTYDSLWNAAQTQLVTEARMHNYLRMLWGKKILEWTPSPREALRVMIELNNRYALDGRDPNSYSGIFWCLGRYDRPWGPERPIFGKVRYMSSANTARKLHVTEYLRKYSAVQLQLPVGEGSGGRSNETMQGVR
jgi:deoxyribodipyrimidine photo-lyase